MKTGPKAPRLQVVLVAIAAGVVVLLGLGTLAAQPSRFWPHTANEWAPVGSLCVLLVALVVALTQLVQSARTRHASLLADLSRRWDEPLLVESRLLLSNHGDKLRQWVERYMGPPIQMQFFVLQRVPNFFEDVAVLESRGAIPFGILIESFGAVIVRTWDAWKPAVAYLRTDEGYEPVYSNFERLAEKMRSKLRLRRD